jgi:hypothetical protein
MMLEPHVLRTTPLSHRPILIPAALVLLSGCSFIVPQTQQISISTIPDGARVTVNGREAGNSPTQATISRGHTTVIVARAPGYHPGTAITNSRISAAGVLDVVGAALFIAPIVGVMADGFYEQKPNHVLITLPPR